MHSRKESGFDLLVRMPWHIALLLAIGIWFSAPYLAGVVAGSSQLLARMHPAISNLLRMLAAVCLAAAAISLIRSRVVARRFALQRSLEDLRQLSWQEFEVIVGEAFRRLGYSVLETGQGGPDGGVDLALTRAGQRFLVQCKQYRSSQVGVTVVREIYGVVAARKATGAIVVTTGHFTKDAVGFARTLPIQLIDGVKLEAMVRGINGGAMRAATAASPLPPPTSAAGAPAANCPRCSSPMVLRNARAGGGQFYGCSRFPKCRGVRSA